MKNKIFAGSIVTVALLPNVVFAVRDLRDLVKLTIEYFNLAIYFIMSLAILFFIWNVFNYFFRRDGDKTEAGKYVMFSVIGFFVMLSFWGLVNLVQNTFKLDSRTPTNGVDTSAPLNTSSGGYGDVDMKYDLRVR